MSKVSESCENFGKHSGTSDFHICERCEAGLEGPCAYYKKFNIIEIKASLISTLLWHWNYLGAATESFNNSDVFGIRRTLFTAEFEIKLTRADLLQEVNIILNIVKNKSISDCRGNSLKIAKHGSYFGYYKRYYHDIMPNEFSFLVPKAFEDIKVKIEKTPYGLYIFKKYSYDSYNYNTCKTEKSEGFDIERIIKPRRLHKEKIGTEYILKFFRKLSTENQILRDRFLGRK